MEKKVNELTEIIKAAATKYISVKTGEYDTKSLLERIKIGIKIKNQYRRKF